MSEPNWLAKARAYLGLREVPGKGTNSTIVKWWKLISAPFTDDETPWCAGFVGGVLEEAGIKSSKSAAARSYMKWGVALAKPAVGAVVVFWRGSKNGYSGHVGFVAGKDGAGNIMVLGGNQGDAVNIKPFGKDRLLGYRWPATIPLPANDNLPVIKSDGKLSTNEA